MDEIPTFEVYLDMLFLLNFMMDYFIFWIVSKMTYHKVSKKRLCFGSAIAALLYCLVVVTPFLRTQNIVLFLVILPLIPIKIIFNPKKIRNWIPVYIMANVTALIVGGMSYGVVYWVQEQKIVSNSHQRTSGRFSMWLLILSSAVSYVLIQIYGYYTQKRNTGIQKLYQMKICYKNQEVAFGALLDTGNKVYDPISKYPVIIVEHTVLKQILPKGINEHYTKKNEDITCLVQEASKYEFGARIRLIPYKSLGNPNGMLLGFKADSVYIEEASLGNKLIEDVIIGIYQYNLSGEDTYHGLLHSDLVS